MISRFVTPARRYGAARVQSYYASHIPLIHRGAIVMQSIHGVVSPFRQPSRKIMTIGESKALDTPTERFITPVPPSKATIYTTMDDIDTFARNNPECVIEEHPHRHSIKDVKFFDIQGKLWATSVDARNPELLYRVAVESGKILGCTPEQMGDKLCLKNVNASSSKPEDNEELHSQIIESALSVQRDLNSEMFKEVRITSNPANPKFTEQNLKNVLSRFNLTFTVVEPKIEVVSVSNDCREKLPHKSRTVSIDLTAAGQPSPGTGTQENQEPAKANG